MGRSVWTHSDAVETVFRTLPGNLMDCPECEADTDGSEMECPECGESLLDESGEMQQFEFEFLVDDVRDTFKRKFPSMDDCDHWPERESRAIVENHLCAVVISEYCGLVSIGVVPQGDAPELAQSWTERNAAPLLRETFGDLRRIGTFSNGESVYERVNT